MKYELTHIVNGGETALTNYTLLLECHDFHCPHLSSNDLM